MFRTSRVFLIVPLVLVLLALFSATPAQSQTSQELLRQYVADLQKNPGDYALREKIIKHVQGMKQKPAIPEETERYMARGAAAVKGAKTEKDFQDAAAEFEKASLAAPWLPAAYYNLGITQDKAGKYREAIHSLKLYLLAAPDASDAKAVKNLTYEIEYRQEKAAKGPSLPAVSAPKQDTFDDLLKKIDGRRYTHSSVDAQGVRYTMVIDVTGRVFRFGTFYPQYTEHFRDEIRGRETTVPITERLASLRVWAVARTYMISDDGERISYRVRYSDGDARDYVFSWQR